MTYIDYETCSECGFQMAYGGECGECADRRPKAARTPADDAGEVATFRAEPPTSNLDVTRAALRREIGPETDRDTSWQPMVSAAEIRLLLDALDRHDEARAEADRLRATLGKVAEKVNAETSDWYFDENDVPYVSVEVVRKIVDAQSPPADSPWATLAAVGEALLDQDESWYPERVVAKIRAILADPVSLADEETKP